MFSRGNTAGRKMDSDRVAEMRLRYEQGETQGALARDFRLSVVQVGRIVRGESWMGSAALRRPSAKQVIFQPSEADIQATLQRIQELQRAKNASPPASLLDGGDTPDETQGAGLSAIADKARELLGR
jgi:hypothetical protein